MPLTESSGPGFEVRPIDNNVRGRLALVTGASGGIGSACARALAEEGCDVALHYRSNSETIKALASELREKFPSQTFTIHCADLSNRQATHGLASAVLAAHEPVHRSISILVLNAGLGYRIRHIQDIGWADWDAMLETNSTNSFILLKDCLDDQFGRMRMQRWGRVVLIGSISSWGGGINGCHYAASKGALTSMGLNLSRVLAPDNITVNCVSPAMIGDTGMVPAAKGPSPDSQQPSPDSGAQLAATIPLGRLGHPSEVANVVMMYVKTGYMTGQDLLLSGGLL